MHINAMRYYFSHFSSFIFINKLGCVLVTQKRIKVKGREIHFGFKFFKIHGRIMAKYNE